MTLDDAAALTRRERRMRSGAIDVPPGAGGRAAPEVDTTPGGTVDTASAEAPAVRIAPESPFHDDDAPAAAEEPIAAAAAASVPPAATGEGAALSWLADTDVTPVAIPRDLVAAGSPYVPVEVSLLADPPRRSPWRPSVLVPTAIIAFVVFAYAATTLLWPLHAVAPEVTAIQVQPAAAAAAEMTWPADGSAAVTVAGISGTPASTPDADAMASITKVVTALVVLDELPLELGEDGPAYSFDYSDNLDYWSYRARGESALDVPVGGSLTQYQMLEGMLIGSANNYADRLASDLFPSDQVFAAAAQDWLTAHGVPGITVVEPTGMSSQNTASPAALLTLAQKAMANPVIAEIVAEKSVELPGAGVVDNTNGLLADEGVVGIKTGTLDRWNLLSAKDIVVGETAVRLYAAVLGQADDEARLEASRSLYDQVEAQLQPFPSVPAGTVAGTVTTLWGSDSDIVTSADATVVLWNGGTSTLTPAYDLGGARAAGSVVGSITADGPLDSATVDLELAADIEPPSAWWRLTHPLELFGLAG